MNPGSNDKPNRRRAQEGCKHKGTSTYTDRSQSRSHTNHVTTEIYSREWGTVDRSVGSVLRGVRERTARGWSKNRARMTTTAKRTPKTKTTRHTYAYFEGYMPGMFFFRSRSGPLIHLANGETTADQAQRFLGDRSTALAARECPTITKNTADQVQRSSWATIPCLCRPGGYPNKTIYYISYIYILSR